MSSWSETLRNKRLFGQSSSGKEVFTSAPSASTSIPLPKMSKENACSPIALATEAGKIPNKKSSDFSGFRDALSFGTTIKGKLSFDSSVRIDGSLDGQVNCSGAVLIGERASIKADISAESAVILGHVTGEIKVRKGVEVLAGAVIEGKVSCSQLVVEPGAVVNSRCRVLG